MNHINRETFKNSYAFNKTYRIVISNNIESKIPF